MTELPTVTEPWFHSVLNPRAEDVLLVEHPGMNDPQFSAEFEEGGLFDFEGFALIVGEKGTWCGSEVHLPPDLGLLTVCDRVDRLIGGDALVQACEALPYLSESGPEGAALTARCVQAAMDSGRCVRLVLSGHDRRNGWIFLLRAEDLDRALDLVAEDIAAWKRREEHP
ncbi:hypothetical protein [Deinococcus aerophilus]|uniref:Uncharacterized protein n=1 Tax=Deinococcus aerophilus TaxID=522488 RepID=A0ABQ2GXF4_9DEIO|nr:hypothetical protein [Deinococcus aerophilus]GGM16386.1 hypothetical protein GCM10010841_25900 [Deinococcus aerophilus]